MLNIEFYEYYYVILRDSNLIASTNIELRILRFFLMYE